MSKRCECPEVGRVPETMAYLYSEAERPGMNHLPNECTCTNQLMQYKREDRILTLCSCCCLSGDIQLPDIEN